MKQLFKDWGFTAEGWRRGQRGEYLVILQGILMMGFVLLPVYPIPRFQIASPFLLYVIWGVAGILEIAALILITKGLMDLGKNLTPLPYPKADGELVQTGVYKIVRHPLYSGLIFASFGWTVFQLSLSHLVGVLLFGIFFDFKSRKEEIFLTEKYPDYSDYRQRVKKLIPWVY